jgi:hypothetical protein
MPHSSLSKTSDGGGQALAYVYLSARRIKIFVNPRGLSVDVLNDNIGDLLRSRASGPTYAERLTHEAEANNKPLTETHTGKSLLRTL